LGGRGAAGPRRRRAGARGGPPGGYGRCPAPSRAHPRHPPTAARGPRPGPSSGCVRALAADKPPQPRRGRAQGPARARSTQPTHPLDRRSAGRPHGAGRRASGAAWPCACVNESGTINGNWLYAAPEYGPRPSSGRPAAIVRGCAELCRAPSASPRLTRAVPARPRPSHPVGPTPGGAVAIASVPPGAPGGAAKHSGCGPLAAASLVGSRALRLAAPRDTGRGVRRHPG
jgi:hypothetical protein